MTDAVTYALAIDGFEEGHFRVHSLTGREVLSEPYAFDIVVTAASEAGEDVERLSLAQRGIFSWNLGGAVRAFYGVVARVRHQGDHESHHATQYAIQIVPRLWLLNHRRRTRIFQNRRVGEIIYAVLREAGIGCRWRLLRDYPVREYCTQYEESDLAFIARLCAESGIYFYFPQGPLLDGAAAAGTPIPGDTVIFGDDASRYPPHRRRRSRGARWGPLGDGRGSQAHLPRQPRRHGDPHGQGPAADRGGRRPAHGRHLSRLRSDAPPGAPRQRGHVDAPFPCLRCRRPARPRGRR